MRSISCFLIGLALISAGFSFSAKAQIGIATPYPVAAGNLTRGGTDTTLLTVKLTFGAAYSGVTTTVLLPQGVVYVPGSVTKTAGTAGVSIADGGGTSRTPQFSVSGVTAAGDLTFTIRRTAVCGGTGAGKDTVKLACGGCSTVTENDPSENSYVIYAPSLAVSAPATINNALPGTAYSRTISVTNGGNGCLDTVRLFLVYPTGGRVKLQDAPVNTLTVGGQSITPASTSGDTLFYKIFGAAAFGVDGKLCNGESVAITEPITVVSCNGSALTTQYGARWGAAGSTCQTATGSALINFSTGAPQLVASITGQPSAIPTCAGIFTYTATITNNGQGPASGMAVALSNSNTSWTNNDRFFIDTASILITLPASSAVHPEGIVTTNVFSMSSIPCVHNKPIRATLGSLASVVLQPAQSMQVTWTVNTTCITGTVCGGTNPQLGTTYLNATYQGVCGGATYTMNSAGVRVGPTLSYTGGSEEYPSEVQAGECFQMKYTVKPNLLTGYNNTSSANVPRKYLQGAITLPAGVTYTSVQELNYGYDSTMYPGYPMQAGNQVIFRLNPTSPLASSNANSTSGSLFTFRINLCRAAGGSTCGNNVIAAEFSLVADSACSPLIVAKDCRTSTISFPCPGVCSGGGTRSLRTAMARSNFGLPDNNGDGFPDASGSLNFSKVDVNHYRPGDTMHSVSSALITAQTSPATINAWNNAYAEWYFSPTNTSTLIWKPSASATIHLTRGGTTHTCSNVGIDTLTTGARYRLKIDTPCFQSLMPFLPDDSIQVIADFVFAPVPSGGGTVSGTSSQLSLAVGDYNAVTRTTVAHVLYASQSAAPPAGGNLGNTGFACETRTYVGYVNGWRHDVVVGSVNANSCNTGTFSGVVQTNANGLTNGGQFFPGEFRPLWIPDTLTFTSPAGWEYTGPASSATTLIYTTSYTYSTTYSPAINVLPVVTGSIATGYTLMYDIKAAKQSAVLPFWGTEGIYFRLQIPVRASCNAPLIASFGVEERGNAAGSYPGPAFRYVNNYTRTDAMTFPATGRPAIGVQNNTGAVSGGTATHFWEVQINNAGLVAAPFTWMTLEKGSAGIEVDSVVLKPSNVVVAPNAFGAGGKWYAIAGSGGLPNQSNQKARVYFRYNSCNTDSLKMTAGYTCGAYPSPDPSNYSCGVQQYLKVVPQPSEIQLSVSRQPGGGSPVGMCSADSTTIIVNSAQAANLLAPVLRAYPPAGMTIASPVQVEYPLGSGAWQSVAATPISGGYEIALNGHTGIGTIGMAGTLTTASATARQAKVKLTFTADCSFVSGRKITVYGYGQRACGGTAIGDGQNVKTSSVAIAGASTGGATMGLSITSPATLGGGDTATVLCTSTPGGTATVAGDTVTYTIPAGLTYGGGFTAGGSCIGCVAVVAEGVAGSTLVKVPLPVGVAPATAIGYSFKVSAQGAGCGALTIDAEAVRTIGGISCGATTCTTSSAVIGTGSGAVVCQKPSIVLNELAIVALAYNYVPGATVPLSLAYTNSGTQALAANRFQVEFFCSTTDTMSFHTAVLPGPLAVNTTRTDTFAVPISSSCIGGQQVTARIRPVMGNGSTQPLCTASMAFTSIALPLELVRFNAALQGDQTAVTWAVASEPNLASYLVERSEDGARFETIASVAARGSAGVADYKHFDEVLPLSPMLYYRLQLVGIDGSRRAGGVVAVQRKVAAAGLSVIPNPASTFVHLEWLSSEGGSARIDILNAVGAKVVSRELRAIKGVNRARLDDVAGLAQGTYLLQLAEAGQVVHVRFTVVR